MNIDTTRLKKLIINDDLSWNEIGKLIEQFKIEIWYMDNWRAAIKYRYKKQLPNGFVVETTAYKFYRANDPLTAVTKCLIAMDEDSGY